MGASRIIRGIGAAIVLVGVVIGAPTFLILAGRVPFASGVPSWNVVVSTLSHPDTNGTLIIGLITIVTWVAWALFTITMVVECVGRIRGRTLRNIPGFRRLVGPLVVAVLVMIPTMKPHSAEALTLSAPPAPTAVVAVHDAGTTAKAPIETPAPTTADTAPAPPEATPPRSYTVQPGDSLWRIAEATLGDGARFHEIAALNYGVPQPDGGSLDTHHWLEPGWVLSIPGDSSSTPGPIAAAPMTSTTYLVQPGESLSTIARDHLGDPSRYGEIFELSRQIIQPNGSVISNPDLIHPGWTVALPSSTAQTPQQQEISVAPLPDSPTPAPTDSQRHSTPEDTPDVVEPPTTEVTPAPDNGIVGKRLHESPVTVPKTHDQQPDTSETPSPSQQHSTPETATADSEPEEGIELRTMVGVGGLLAAGVLSLVALRRVQTRRRRQHGERVCVPQGTTAARFEASARAIADPVGRAIVDRALRLLAVQWASSGVELPPLRALRYAPERFVEIFLDFPCILPAPWTTEDDRTVWRLRVDDVWDLPYDAQIDRPAPYPTLVTVGQDREAHLMLDLERLGCLDIRGPIDEARAALAALAVELGTNIWADDLQVTVVGTLAELPGVVDTGRIRHLPSLDLVMRDLHMRAQQVETALREGEFPSIAAARASGQWADAWTPEVLLIGEPLPPAVRNGLELLVSRVPNVGVVAVTIGSDLGQWFLEVDPQEQHRAIVQPAGVPVWSQRLSPSDYVSAVALLRETGPVPGPGWARQLAVVPEPQLFDIPVPGFSQSSAQPDQHAATVVHMTRTPREESLTSPRWDTTAFRPVAVAGERTWDALDVGPIVADPLEPLDVSGYGASWNPINQPFAGSDSLKIEESPDDQTTPRATSGPSVRHQVTLSGVASWGGGVAMPSSPSDMDDVEDVTVVNVLSQLMDERTMPTGGVGPQATITALRTPIVRVLGPVEVDAPSSITLQSSHQKQVTELITYLAFHPGASGLDLSHALWPTRPPNLSTRRSAVSRARRWLGVDAEGQEYLPRFWMYEDGTQEVQEAAGYRLRGVRTDWEEFLDLVGPDITQVPTPRLIQALALVRGPVFAQVPARRYVWAEALWQEITAGVVDVAHEVARRSLLSGDIAQVREAARIGRVVDPVDERIWRDAIRAEWAGGQVDGVQRLITQMRNHIESLELCLDPETEDLITEVEDQRGWTRGA